MSLQDDIQALSESGWQALDASTKSRLKASVDMPALQAISDNGWQGVDDSTKSVLREKWSAAPMPAPTQAQEPSPAPGWSEAIFPTLSRKKAQQAQALRPGVPDGLDAVSGAGYDPNSQQGAVSRWAGRQWPAMRDMLTMPLRAAAGAGSAMGQTLGGANSLGDLFQGIGLRRLDVSEAFRQGMADPRGQAQEFRAYTPTAQRYIANPALFAGMADDPATGPGIALGATAMRPLLQGFATSAINAGARNLDQMSQGQAMGVGASDFVPSMNFSDLVPAALGAVGPIGGAMKRGANSWFRQMVKPAGIKAGKEVEGFENALAADLLPEMTGWSATVGGAGKQYLRRLGQEGAEVEPILANADLSGMKVSPAEAISEAEKAMIQAIKEERLGGTIAEAKSGLDWVRARAHKPTGDNVDLAWRGVGAPSNDILPSIAHRRKSNLYDAAYEKNPAKDDISPLASKLFAIKEVARSFRRQLGEISPEYAAKMSYLAPRYGAEDAMTRAALIRANRNVMNPMNLINIPAAARMIWEGGNLLSRGPNVSRTGAVAVGGLLDGIRAANMPVDTANADGAMYRR